MSMSDVHTFSVSELTAAIKIMLETGIGYVRLRGEVSNFKRHSSGHFYFTLKDAAAQISAVMWRSYADRLSFDIEDGLELVVEGELQVYAPQGKYQISCITAKPVGEGYLQQEFLRLFEKLNAQGLFDEALKRPLPRYPERIGIITSSTGAVIEDIKKILARRYPAAQLILYPARVQGEGAAEELIAGVECFNCVQPRPDVLILARGGGSIEDLWPFNSEALAYEIRRSEIPIISAVGHETDFTIADYAADVRASTPSMAAEIVAPPAKQILEDIEALMQSLNSALQTNIRQHIARIDSIVNSYAFNRPKRELATLLQRLDYAEERLTRSITERVRTYQALLDHATQRLSALGHGNILKRGYIVAFKQGHAIGSAQAAQPGDELLLHFHDGVRHVRVKS
jgi:exodeoxyribonuclease VII, large subunit